MGVREDVHGTVLLCDISGYTALTERLGRQGRGGAEQVAGLVQALSLPLLEAASSRGGELLVFGGDALALLFTDDDDVARAADAAAAMRDVLAGSRATTGRRVRMSFVLEQGVWQLHRVGSREWLVVRGEAVERLLALDARAHADEVLVGPLAAAALPARCLVRSERGVRLARRPGRREPVPAVPERGRADGAEFRFAALGFVHLLVGPETDEEGLAGRFLALEEGLVDGVEVCSTDLADDGFKVLLACFGVERPEERLVEVLRRFLDETQRLDWPARAGVASGVVLSCELGPAGNRLAGLFGDAINTAARVQSGAARGQLLATEAALARCRGRFELAGHEPLRAKGKRDLVLVRAVVGRAFSRGSRTTDLVPLVGREDELQWWRAVRHADKGTSVAVVGDAGHGKSRLLQEVAGAWDGPVLWHTCSPLDQQRPWSTAAGLLRALPAPPPEELAGLAHWLEAAGLGGAERTRQVGTALGIAVQPQSGDVPASAVAAETCAALASVLERRVPPGALLVLDDAVHADPSSVPVLRALADRAPEHGWVVAVTGRDASGPVAVPFRRRVLGPLGDEDAARLVAQVRGAPTLSVDVDRLVARGGGNPLFLVELARTAGEDEPPVDVEDLLAARVAALPPGARGLLRAAAVAGDDASADLVERLAAELGDDAASWHWPQLDSLLAQDDARRVRFRSPLVREVTYAGISVRARRSLHASTAAYLAAADRPDPTSLSYHLERAGDLAGAWEWSRAAAATAVEQGAQEEAAHLYARALRCAPSGDDARRDLSDTWRAYAGRLTLLGRTQEARRAYARCRRLAVDDAQRAQGLAAEITLLREGGQFDAAYRRMRRASVLLAPYDDPALVMVRLDMLNQMAWVRVREARFAEAGRLARELLDAAEAAGSEGLCAWAHQVLGEAAQASGRLDEAERHFALSHELFQRGGTPTDQASSDGNRAVQLERRGELREALALGLRSRERLRALGGRLNAALAGANTSTCLLTLGRPVEAEALLAASTAELRAAGRDPLAGTVALWHARALVEAGRPDDALQALELAEDLAGDDAWYLMEAASLLPWVLLLCGRPAEALEQPFDLDQARSLHARSLALLAVGDVDAAEAVHADAAALARAEGPVTADLVEVQWAAGRGRLQQVTPLLDRLRSRGVVSVVVPGGTPLVL